MKEIFAEGDIDEIIKALKPKFEGQIFIDELDLIQARHKQLNNKKLAGLLSSKEFTKESNSIRHDLSLLINRFYIDFGIKKSEFVGLWAVLSWSNELNGYSIEKRFVKINDAFNNDKVLKIEIEGMNYEPITEVGEIHFLNGDNRAGNLFIRYENFPGAWGPHIMKKYSIYVETGSQSLETIIRVFDNKGEEKYILARPKSEEEFNKYIHEEFLKSVPDLPPIDLDNWKTRIEQGSENI